MSRKIKIYQTLAFAFMCLSIILLLIMGITAIQKSMELNVKFQVSPKYQCEVLLGGNSIFCNTSENSKTPTFKSGASLSGNTLSLNQTLTGDLGATLNFTIYNYSNLDIKVSIKNTSDYVILDKYPSGTITSKTLTTTNSTGLVEFVFEEIQYCTITFNSNDGTNTTKTQSIIQGETSTLISNTFTRDGYNFNGWNTEPDGSGTAYVNCAEIVLNKSTELIYAMWEEAIYTLTLNFSYEGDTREVTEKSDGSFRILVTNDLDYNYTYDTGVVTYTEEKEGYVYDWFRTSPILEETMTLSVQVGYRVFMMVTEDSMFGAACNYDRVVFQSVTVTEPNSFDDISAYGWDIDFIMPNDDVTLNIVGYCYDD